MEFRKTLPSYKKIKKDTKAEEILLIYDSQLEKFPFFKTWRKTFPFSYKVKAGEPLKSLHGFPKHIEKILNISPNISKHWVLVSVGGGSVGDFSGFVASVLKRGLPWVHLPSTWLSALDSSHGGKTALNVKDIKNQVGTFYMPLEIYIVQKLLFQQGQELALAALGELIKISLIDSEKLYRFLLKQKKKMPLAVFLWESLPQAIQSKMKIVLKDPKESKGLREVLNFGHTFGHVLESAHKIPHGLAVLEGIRFSLKWSLSKKMISKKSYEKIINDIDRLYKIPPLKKNSMSQKTFLEKIQKDKKKYKNKIRFIFLGKPGQAIMKYVSVSEILKQAKKENYIQ